VFKFNQGRAEWSGRILLILMIVLFYPGWAQADSTSITGTATYNNDSLGFSASGPALSFTLAGEEGLPTSAVCAAGTLCDFTKTIPAYCIGFTSIGSYNGQTAYCLGGELTFAASTILPIIPSGVSVEYILPVVVTGQIIGFAQSGPDVFAFNIDGTGTLTTNGGTFTAGTGTEYYVFGGDRWQFSAIATTPEPSTILLLSSGLLPITLRFCSRLRRKVPQRNSPIIS